MESPSIIAQSDCGDPASRVSMPLNITLEQETEVSMGYVVNFPGGETNALSLQHLLSMQFRIWTIK